jgi:hypothetical protein
MVVASVVRMRRFPSSLAPAIALAAVLSVVPLPVAALGPPETLMASRSLGTVDGPGPPVDPDFSVDYLGVSWGSGALPSVRFRDGGGTWGPWSRVHEDEIPTVDGRTWSALIPAGDADAYQVRGRNGAVRAVAINTTDGPRPLRWGEPQAVASHLTQPAVVTREGWGADESLRCKANGEPKFSWTFYPTRKLIVHHTVTANADPDPAATVRAIYQYHVQSRGFIDIAYNFLVDANGTIYKGRYSGPNGTCFQDTLTGENANRRGVTGAHTGGWNSGTMGIAVLGNYEQVPLSEATRAALVEHLAWESERHLLDPLATSTFTNPAGGGSTTVPNISGHRDWSATACPGKHLYALLPTIRQEVAARTGTIAALDTTPPRISRVRSADVQRRRARIRWRTSEPATSRVRYWVPGRSRRLTPRITSLRRSHEVALRGLRPGTAYRYVVISRDAAGNAAKDRRLLRTRG